MLGSAMHVECFGGTEGRITLGTLVPARVLTCVHILPLGDSAIKGHHGDAHGTHQCCSGSGVLPDKILPKIGILNR